MNILGIDPGLSGALCILDPIERGLEIIDMPVVELERNKKTKREVAAAMVYEALVGKDIQFAFLERVGAMPGQGVTSMLSLGRSVGVIEGVVAAMGIPLTLVIPQRWQKDMLVRGGKDGSRERAMQLFPMQSELFKRKKDDGRADAALIAMWGEKFGRAK